MDTHITQRAGSRRTSTLSLQAFVVGVSASVLMTGLLVSGAGVYVSGHFKDTISVSSTLMASMRHHMTADMLHDGLRGVVYSGLYGGVSDNRELAANAQSDIVDYAAQFRAEIAEQEALPLPLSVANAVEGVKAPLEAYIASGESILARVAAGDLATAQSSLVGFDASFQALVGPMSEVSDAIEEANLIAAKEAIKTSQFSDIANWGGVTLIMLLVGCMLVFLRRFLIRPLVDMTNALGKLSEGDLSATASEEQTISEVGGLARVVVAFRSALENSVSLAQRAAKTEDERVSLSTALNRDIAGVVSAAVNGDLSGRITAAFADPELNALARNINDLVGTFDASVSETGKVLSALARTDLTMRVEGNYSGALAKLKTDTNALVDNLNEVVGQLRSTSGTLKVATGEILSGANDLAERTTKQAAAIEETSAAMEQLSTTVSENATRAESANHKAKQVSVTAEEAGDVMRRSNEAMERISNSSAKISNIIGLIDDIAFQTNLLALNASVEAARAGDAGKGFAVVAVEVRRLAQSAANASSEVKTLIEQSGTEVSSGGRLVAEATTKLVSMLDGIRESAGLTDAIAQATREQSSAIAEVTTAIRQMDEMTQHNAALVEETNAAIEQTEGQANELDRIVEVFVVDDSARAVERAPQRARAPQPASVRGQQARVKQAASAYLSEGNAAVKQEDWSEF